MKAFELNPHDLFTNNERYEIYECLGSICDDQDNIIDIRCVVIARKSEKGWRLVATSYDSQPKDKRKKPQRISFETTYNPYAEVQLIELL